MSRVISEQEDAHHVIATINRLIAEQEETFVNSMWRDEILLRQMIINCLKEEKERQLKFLDSFNQQGAAP